MKNFKFAGSSAIAALSATALLLTGCASGNDGAEPSAAAQQEGTGAASGDSIGAGSGSGHGDGNGHGHGAGHGDSNGATGSEIALNSAAKDLLKKIADNKDADNKDTDTKDAAPKRIVAVTPEVSDIALQLVGKERVVGVSNSSANPEAGNVSELARGVENKVAPGTNPDVEQIMTMEPDLVLTTTRHGGEETLGSQLNSTSVPAANFGPDLFNSPEGIVKAVTEIGALLGAEDKAKELTYEFTKKIEQLDAKKITGGPSTLSLMARGTQVMAMDDSQMLPGLVKRAGGSNAGEKIGLNKTRPVDAEQMLAANPDVLFIEDFMGMGLGPFEELLKNPALSEVPAIKNDKIVVIPMKEASGVSALHSDAGYKKVLDALNK